MLQQQEPISQSFIRLSRQATSQLTLLKSCYLLIKIIPISELMSLPLSSDHCRVDKVSPTVSWSLEALPQDLEPRGRHPKVGQNLFLKLLANN